MLFVLKFVQINRIVSRGQLAQWKNTRFVIFRSQGDRGSNPAEDFFFHTQSFLISTQMFDGNSNYRTGYISHATLPIEEAVATISLLGEEEHSLVNWSYHIIS